MGGTYDSPSPPFKKVGGTVSLVSPSSYAHDSMEYNEFYNELILLYNEVINTFFITLLKNYFNHIHIYMNIYRYIYRYVYISISIYIDPRVLSLINLYTYRYIYIYILIICLFDPLCCR